MGLPQKLHFCNQFIVLHYELHGMMVHLFFPFLLWGADFILVVGGWDASGPVDTVDLIALSPEAAARGCSTPPNMVQPEASAVIGRTNGTFMYCGGNAWTTTYSIKKKWRSVLLPMLQNISWGKNSLTSNPKVIFVQLDGFHMMSVQDHCRAQNPLITDLVIPK